MTFTDTLRQQRLPVLLVAAGLSLYPLLAVGLAVGVTGFLFNAFFALHLGLLLWASVAGLAKIISLWKDADLAARVLSFLAFALAIGFVASQGLLPITARDALIHHLAVPKWWLESGKIIPTTWHEWSLYPMHLQLAYAGFIGLGLDYLTPFYHSLYLLCLAALCGDFTNRYSQTSGLAQAKPKEKQTNSSLGICTAALVLNIPLLMKLASTPLVDLALALYCTIAILQLSAWLKNSTSYGTNDTETSNYYPLILAGLALGLAAATKPNGCVVAGVLVAVFFAAALSCRGSTQRVHLKHLVLASIVIGLAAILAFAPWAIKNYTTIGNPIFPLAKSIFGPTSPASTSGLHGLSPIAQRMAQYNESILEVVLLPVRVFLWGEDDNPRWFDGRLSPLLLLSLFGLIRFRKEPWAQLMGYSALLYLLLALSLTGARVRYLIPFVPTLAILSELSLHKLKHEVGLLRALILFQLLWAGLFACQTTLKSGALQYFSSAATPTDYLSAHIPEYAAIEYINHKLPLDSKVYLLLTGNRFYYYERPTFSSGHFSGDAFVTWIKQSKGATELLATFKEHGITHILAQIPRTQKYLSDVLTETKDKVIRDEFFTEHLRPIYTANDHALMELY